MGKYKKTWYKALAVLYYISSGVFLFGWALNRDYFTLFMYFCFAGLGLIFDVLFTKELLRGKKR